jgi:hypothetical protein
MDSGLTGAELQRAVATLSPETPYHWRLRVLSSSPLFPRSRWLSPQGNGPLETDFRTGPEMAVGVGAGAVGPGRFISAPVPNPSRAATRFSLELEAPTRVRVAVFDVAGRQVRLLAEGRFGPGRRDLLWDGTTDSGVVSPAGVYFVRAEGGGMSASRRLVRTR